MFHKIGIIGGSGLDNPHMFSHARDVHFSTPWGEPSCPLREGEVEGVPVVLLARHGREHTIPPSQVNYRANIHALRDAGCSCILASTAVGSLREDIKRGDLVVPDQFIDFTKQRRMTFHESFTAGNPVHCAMPDPFDAALRAALAVRAHNGADGLVGQVSYGSIVADTLVYNKNVPLRPTGYGQNLALMMLVELLVWDAQGLL